MQLRKLLQVATVLCTTSAFAPAQAEPTFFVSPMVGIAVSDAEDFDNGPAAHLGFGVNLTDVFALELKGFYNELDIDAPQQYRQKGASIDAMYKFLRRPGIELYGVTGLGFVRQDVPGDGTQNDDDSSVDPNFDLGVGALIPLGSAPMALRGDIRYRNDYHGNADLYGRSSFYQIISTVGVLFPYSREANAGAASPPPPPPPVAPEPAALDDEPVPEPEPEDSDNDGVFDDDDLCPNTPAGAVVDSAGCQEDSDDDGVVDGDDRCPGTPAERAVNAQGCELDGDNDGVVDANDKCPNTPAGEKVNSEGCPLDDDGDGVDNADDECANTPAGNKVLPNGCSVVKKLVLEGVNFETDSSKLTRNAKAVLDDAAEAIIGSPAAGNLLVAGHTDSRGNSRYNQRLSEQRAASARRYLIQQGVKAGRLKDKGFGESKPIATNDTPEGLAKNRRVELSPMKGDGSSMSSDEGGCDCADASDSDSSKNLTGLDAAVANLTSLSSLTGKASAQVMADMGTSNAKAVSAEPMFIAFSGRTLTGQARRQLDKVAGKLLTGSNLAMLEVEGKATSAQAKSVHRYLVKKGVKSDDLATVLKGEMIHVDYGK